MVAVPCNGCTACCRNQLIVLTRQDGDDYETRIVAHPSTGKPVRALRQRDNGDCVYLTDHGCAIHERAPMTCRKFDCRALFQRVAATNTPLGLELLSSRGLIDADILQAGQERSQ